MIGLDEVISALAREGHTSDGVMPVASRVGRPSKNTNKMKRIVEEVLDQSKRGYKRPAAPVRRAGSGGSGSVATRSGANSLPARGNSLPKRRVLQGEVVGDLKRTARAGGKRLDDIAASFKRTGKTSRAGLMKMLNKGPLSTASKAVVPTGSKSLILSKGTALARGTKAAKAAIKGGKLKGVAGAGVVAALFAAPFIYDGIKGVFGDTEKGKAAAEEKAAQMAVEQTQAKLAEKARLDEAEKIRLAAEQKMDKINAAQESAQLKARALELKAQQVSDAAVQKTLAVQQPTPPQYDYDMAQRAQLDRQAKAQAHALSMSNPLSQAQQQAQGGGAPEESKDAQIARLKAMLEAQSGQGQNGQNGQGQDGQGQNGRNGQNGQNGQNGYNGHNGHNGYNGRNGYDRDGYGQYDRGQSGPSELDLALMALASTGKAMGEGSMDAARRTQDMADRVHAQGRQ